MPKPPYPPYESKVRISLRENAEKPEGFIDHLLARTTTPSVPGQFESRAMDIAPIKTKRDYHRMLKKIEGLRTAKRNTPEGDRLDALVTLVEAWEAKHYPLDLPHPVAAICYHME